MTDPRRLLAAVDRRIRAFLDDGDRLPLFEPRATADAEALLEVFMAAGQPVPVEVVEAVAWLHWSRWRALPTGDDLSAARELFAVLGRARPDLVPAEFRGDLLTDAARILDGLTADDDPARLDAAIAMLEHGIGATPADDPHRGVHLLNLANGYRMRGRLDAAVQAARAALDTGRFAGFGADTFRHTLEFVLDERYRLTQRPEDLDDLIEVMRAPYASTAADDPEWPLRAGRLAETILIRYGGTGQDRDLDEAITVGRAALAGGHDRLPWFGSNLAASLVWRFEQSGDPADLREAITVFQRTADALPDGDPARVTCLSGLGGALTTLFNADGDPGRLTEAITVGRAAVAAGPADATAHANLALSLRTRFLATGDPADLDESIRLARVAAADTNGHDPNHGMFVSALGVSLQIRFEQFGRIGDLDDAVAAGRSAAAILTTGHPGRHTTLINLANALRTRASLRGELADLHESVDVCRTVLAGLPTRHRQQATALANLALALRDRYLALHDPADIDEAVDTSRAAVAALGATDPERPVYLMGLTRILRTRHKHEAAHDDVDEALQAARAAVAAGGGSPPPADLHRGAEPHPPRAVRGQRRRTGPGRGPAPRPPRRRRLPARQPQPGRIPIPPRLPARPARRARQRRRHVDRRRGGRRRPAGQPHRRGPGLGRLLRPPGAVARRLAGLLHRDRAHSTAELARHPTDQPGTTTQRLGRPGHRRGRVRDPHAPARRSGDRAGIGPGRPLGPAAGKPHRRHRRTAGTRARPRRPVVRDS
ncbi:tetratricopeptide repeat protein [Actinoplanes flavus]|uniref:Tetratricopeptide repeat protein n=1 Tax=Actinoplanes flavus TaxID=2820290 RepID=A0ABS3UWW4_9ACTN|nr:tetratricopeptide repeat protein [Actinoplanes flavus]MBO3743072.1 tetratricopeptide repeat protein [Actinoplanes flavus]